MTTNSFFDNFKYLNVAICIEIIKANLCLKFNTNKTQKYLSQEKNINVSDKIIRKVFHKIRETYYYYLIVYKVEEFVVENERQYFACGESKFTTLNNELICVLDMINKETKDFYLVVKIRDTEKIKTFITRYIPPGIFIVTDAEVVMFCLTIFVIFD